MNNTTLAFWLSTNLIPGAPALAVSEPPVMQAVRYVAKPACVVPQHEHAHAHHPEHTHIPRMPDGVTSSTNTAGLHLRPALLPADPGLSSEDLFPYMRPLLFDVSGGMSWQLRQERDRAREVRLVLRNHEGRR